MDLNLVVVAGTIATEPEVRTFDSGATLIRYLVTVRTDEPHRRVDVLPVTLWDPGPAQLAEVPDAAGRFAWVAGSIQRRFWATHEGRSSRIEIVAHEVKLRDEPCLADGERPSPV
jgi:single-stranded DNA-binding protein